MLGDDYDDVWLICPMGLCHVIGELSAVYDAICVVDENEALTPQAELDIHDDALIARRLAEALAPEGKHFGLAARQRILIEAASAFAELANALTREAFAVTGRRNAAGLKELFGEK